MASRHASMSPPVERSITVSAPHFRDHCSFSNSSSVPLETGEAPILALTLVRLARPIAIGSSEPARWLMLAGMTIRPAAISSRTCSGIRCGSRSATRCIASVIVPSRAYSSWVTGVKPVGGTATIGCSPRLCPQQPFGSTLIAQPSGRKSHAVLPLGGGIPGVSGLEYMSGPPTSAASEKLPGVVPAAVSPGFPAPCMGMAPRNAL